MNQSRTIPIEMSISTTTAELLASVTRFLNPSVQLDRFSEHGVNLSSIERERAFIQFKAEYDELLGRIDERLDWVGLTAPESLESQRIHWTLFKIQNLQPIKQLLMESMWEQLPAPTN
jgi:hypothetical protein